MLVIFWKIPRKLFNSINIGILNVLVKEQSDAQHSMKSRAERRFSSDERLAQEIAQHGRRVAFLSTPSLYFSSTKDVQQQSVLFDFDEQFISKVPNAHNFVRYDYRKPEEIPTRCHRCFDMVVADPPFITHEVWNKYADAIRLISNEDSTQHSPSSDVHNESSKTTDFFNKYIHVKDNMPHDDSLIEFHTKILLTTIPENAEYLHRMLGVALCRFRPSIPNLIYQYSTYTNYESSLRDELNTEIDQIGDDVPTGPPPSPRRVRLAARLENLGSAENLVHVDALSQHSSVQRLCNGDIHLTHSSRKKPSGFRLDALSNELT